MRRLLVRLYPRAWRDQFGDGLAALVEETELDFGIVVDCLKGAALAHIRVHRMLAAWAATIVWVLLSEVGALRTGLTVNVLWPPTSALRALGLLATFVPPAVLMSRVRSRLASS